MNYGALIGKRILELMKEREWNIATVARLAGLPHSTVNKIVHNERANPSILTVQAIAKAFKMEISAFFDTPELNGLTKEDFKR